MQSVHIAVCGWLFVSPLLAQTTWIVNAGGGPGVQFTSLATAVATAASGDTILVQFPPMLQAVGGFTTDKGLTIVGEGGGVPIVTSTPIVIENLPAGERFRMVGFQQVVDGELRARVENCTGAVHLEDLHAREPGFLSPLVPSILVTDSAAVSLVDIEDFGFPAVRIVNSRVVLNGCRLGKTTIGLGGGPCLAVDVGAEVDVVEPAFDADGTAIPIEVAGASIVRIGGSTASYLAALDVFGGGMPLLVTTNSTVVLDPAVQLVTGLATPLFAVSGPAPTFGSLPGSWCGRATPGQNVAIHSSAAVGSAVFQVLGRALAPTPTPLGVLGIDPGQPYLFFAGAFAPASGVVTNLLFVPTTVPLGETFATQALVFDGVSLALGTPAVFTVR